jgi:hypothetical protein
MFRTIVIAAMLALMCGFHITDVQARSVKLVRTGVFALNTSLLMRAMAKELCSAWYVARIGEEEPFLQAIEMGLERAQLPITPGLVKALTGVEISPAVTEIEVDVTLLGAIASLFRGERAIAGYDPEHPRFGCTLKGEGRSVN